MIIHIYENCNIFQFLQVYRFSSHVNFRIKFLNNEEITMKNKIKIKKEITKDSKYSFLSMNQFSFVLMRSSNRAKRFH